MKRMINAVFIAGALICLAAKAAPITKEVAELKLKKLHIPITVQSLFERGTISDSEAVQLLLENRADPNTTYNGKTVLQLSKERKNSDIVSLLKKHGAKE